MLSRWLALVLASIALVLSACTSSSPELSEETVGGEAVDEAVDSGPHDDVVPIISTGADDQRDLIRPDDPSAYVCLVDLGPGEGEFYDKAADRLIFDSKTHFFEARYSDGSTVEIRIHPDLLTEGDAVRQAERVAIPIGLLPTELRSGIERVGFLDGDSTAQADGGGEGIHIYEQNVTLRESTQRFEETIFHESVHTSLDDLYADSAAWQAAQTADGGYLTEYASEQPEREDLAETALYAWALQHYPDRISGADAAAWRTQVPNRLEFVASVLSAPGEAAVDSSVSC